MKLSILPLGTALLALCVSHSFGQAQTADDSAAAYCLTYVKDGKTQPVVITADGKILKGEALDYRQLPVEVQRAFVQEFGRVDLKDVQKVALPKSGAPITTQASGAGRPAPARAEALTLRDLPPAVRQSVRRASGGAPSTIGKESLNAFQFVYVKSGETQTFLVREDGSVLKKPSAVTGEVKAPAKSLDYRELPVAVQQTFVQTVGPGLDLKSISKEQVAAFKVSGGEQGKDLIVLEDGTVVSADQ